MSNIRCMSLTYHYLHYFSFNISNILCEIEYPLTLIQSMLKVYSEYIWGIIGGLIPTKRRDRLSTPGYCLFFETKLRIYGAHGNRFFHFILSFTTAVTTSCYCDSKTLSTSVVFTGLFISLCGSW